MRRLLAIALVCAPVATGCVNRIIADYVDPRTDIGPSDAADAADTDAGGAGDGSGYTDVFEILDGSGDTPPPRPPTLDEVQAAVFAPYCSPCHTDRVSGELSLRDSDTLEQNLLAPSLQLPSMARVAPGDPLTSYLWLKVTGDHERVGGLGEQMPIGPALPDEAADLLRRWIESL